MTRFDSCTRSSRGRFGGIHVHPSSSSSRGSCVGVGRGGHRGGHTGLLVVVRSRARARPGARSTATAAARSCASSASAAGVRHLARLLQQPAWRPLRATASPASCRPGQLLSTQLYSGGLVCGQDSKCRASCMTAQNCLMGQQCTQSVCYGQGELDGGGSAVAAAAAAVEAAPAAAVGAAEAVGAAGDGVVTARPRGSSSSSKKKKKKRRTPGTPRCRSRARASPHRLLAMATASTSTRPAWPSPTAVCCRKAASAGATPPTSPSAGRQCGVAAPGPPAHPSGAGDRHLSDGSQADPLYVMLHRADRGHLDLERLQLPSPDDRRPRHGSHQGNINLNGSTNIAGPGGFPRVRQLEPQPGGGRRRQGYSTERLPEQLGGRRLLLRRRRHRCRQRHRSSRRGGTYGTASLIPLVAGSGGGYVDSRFSYPGPSGGALQISAGQSMHRRQLGCDPTPAGGDYYGGGGATVGRSSWRRRR